MARPRQAPAVHEQRAHTRLHNRSCCPLQSPYLCSRPLPLPSCLQRALAAPAFSACWTLSAAASCAWRGRRMRRRGRPLLTWQGWWPSSGGGANWVGALPARLAARRSF
jgi:hypothetical protein